MINILFTICTDAAKKYHEYLVRMTKPIDDEVKCQQERASRHIQRRQRVWKKFTAY